MDMQNFINDYNYKAGKNLEIKIGIHHGNCIFGLIGYHKPQFSLIGDTVNKTSRHCTTGNNRDIVISKEAYDTLENPNQYKWLVSTKLLTPPIGKIRKDERYRS